MRSISSKSTHLDLHWDKIFLSTTGIRYLGHITLTSKNSIRMIINIKKEASWINCLIVTFRRLSRNSNLSKELGEVVAIYSDRIRMKISILISKEIADMKDHWSLTLMMIYPNQLSRRFNLFRAPTLQEGRHMGNLRRRDMDARTSLDSTTLNSL